MPGSAMSTPAETTKLSSSVAPESPTTARPLEMDDDDVQESGVLDTNTAAAPSSGDVPPPKPPRPMTEHQKNLLMLKEAFPSIDEPIIKAVLTASGGLVEPAFNALLQMTDPDAARDDDQPPPQPPRPAQQPLPPSSTPLTQLEADELYARQLAEHYENVGAYEARTANPPPGSRPRRQQTGFRTSEEDHDRERSFMDDELPVIKESLRKGFIETQSKVNTWFTNLKKKIDEEFADDGYEDDQNHQHGRVGRRPGEPSRRSADYDRYDADPQLLTDDFAGMKFHSDGTPARDQRPLANPGVFKPPPKSASPGSQHHGRKVAFKEQVEDIDDLYDDGTPKPLAKDVPASKASKWQPLSTVEPSPIAENDPFSLGDSEDEKDAKEKSPPKPEGDSLQKATAEAMADSLVDSAPKKPGTDGKKD